MRCFMLLLMTACTATKDGGDTSGSLGATDDSGSGATEQTYAGGWPIDACSDAISATGDRAGDVAHGWTRMDQFGEQIALHDFCDHTVLLVGSAFW